MFSCSRLFGAPGGIGRCSGVYVEEPSVSCVARSVTISIAMIGRGTLTSAFLAARRLRELPDCSVRDSTLRGRRRIVRKSAAGRGRTHVIEYPKGGIK